ncbi:unnamed protein product [Protopolystoma xenopodis]|uniref:Uncharacterized protein n=1 Tax=Protopolystoma xenopodis TaxID=117903 RepID=A0A3S5AXA6_9PLAT|nr:unnamed protein product [Protopolystoma xenopodis]
MNRHSSSADRYHRHTHERRCVLDLTTVSGRLAPCLEESPTFSDSITETSSKQTLDIAAPERPVLNSRVNLPPHLAMPPGPPTSPVPSPPLATGFICQNLGGQLCQTQCQGLANHPTQLISIDGGQGHSSQSGNVHALTSAVFTSL